MVWLTIKKWSSDYNNCRDSYDTGRVRHDHTRTAASSRYSWTLENAAIVFLFCRCTLIKSHKGSWLIYFHQGWGRRQLSQIHTTPTQDTKYFPTSRETVRPARKKKGYKNTKKHTKVPGRIHIKVPGSIHTKVPGVIPDLYIGYPWYMIPGMNMSEIYHGP